MTQKTIHQYTLKNILHQQILKVCHTMELPLHYNRKGPKTFTNYQRVGLIVLFLRSKKALRDFVSELYEMKWVSWLGLKEIPGKSTLHDWLKLFDLTKLRQFNQQVLVDQQPKMMAVDATGIDSWQRSRHYERRIGASYMPYAKLDILVDTNTLFIYDFVLRIKPRHDVLGAKTMFKRMKNKNILILADRGYDSEPLHKIAKEKGNLMFAPVRDFHVRKPGGSNRRRCSKGNKQYSRRNTVESVIHSLKSRFTSLRSKKACLKKRELAWQVIVYNLQKISKQLAAYLKLLFNCLFRTRPFIKNKSEKN